MTAGARVKGRVRDGVAVESLSESLSQMNAECCLQLLGGDSKQAGIKEWMHNVAEVEDELHFILDVQHSQKRGNLYW